MYISSSTSSTYDSTEEAIKQMIDAIRKRIHLHNGDERREAEAAEAVASTAKTKTIIMNPAIKKHCELQITTLQTAPRDVANLKRIIKEKEKQREEDTSIHVEDMQDLVSEIEMLKVVLLLINRNGPS